MGKSSPHGTRAKYQSGCTCNECCDANTDYSYRLRLRKGMTTNRYRKTNVRVVNGEGLAVDVRRQQRIDQSLTKLGNQDDT